MARKSSVVLKGPNLKLVLQPLHRSACKDIVILFFNVSIVIVVKAFEYEHIAEVDRMFNDVTGRRGGSWGGGGGKTYLLKE